jgi:hypothetical protein
MARGMAVGFENDLLRAISEANDPTTGGVLIKNGIGDQGHGLELEMIANPGDGWSGRASYSLFRARRKGGDSKVANSPSGLGKLNATIPATGHGLLGVELLYTGPQSNYFGQATPSSFLTNVSISTRFRRSGWSGSASCYNLFDRYFAAPTGPEVLSAATTQDGRTWRVTMGYKWRFEPARSRP